MKIHLCPAKEHFIAGAIIGATVNVLVQSTEMAMDYDRPFDWSEFFLCAGAGAFTAGKDVLRRVPNSFPSVRNLLSAALVAWAICGKRSPKLSRTTRLALWSFGISHLSHITLDCTTAKRINLI